MSYKHTNSKGKTYYLNTKLVNFGGKERPIYFFSKDERDTATDLPEGASVSESPRSGLPMVKLNK